MFLQRLAILALSLAALAAPAHADEPPGAAAPPAESRDAAEDDEETFDLDEIVVTGSLSKLRLSDTPANVSVIPRDRIRKLRPLDAAEPLPQMPGVFLRRSGPAGALATFSVRGSSSTETQVLLDGRPLNQPSVGSADLAPIPSDLVDRVELVRGPYSALYGPYALSGALQMVSRGARPEDGPGRLRLQAGGLGTNLFSGDFHFDLGGGSRLLVVPTVRNVQGNRPNSQSSLTSGFVRYDADLGSEDRTLTVSGGFQSQLTGTPGPQPAAGVALRTSSQTYLGNDEVSSTVDHQQDRNGFLNAQLQWGELQARAWASTWNPQFHFEYLDFFDSVHMGDASSAQLQNGLDLRYRFPHLEDSGLTVGGTLEYSRLNSRSSDYDTVLDTTTFSGFDARRQVQSLYLEELLQLGTVAASLGVRVDRPSDFAEVVSPRASVLWKAQPWLSLRGGWGRGYRPPTLFELHQPTDPFSSGNPNLRPQTSTSSELGLEALVGETALLRFTAFRESSKDRIVYAPVGPMGAFGPLFVPANLDRFRKVGWEAEVDLELAPGLTVSGAHSRIDAVQVNQELVDAANFTLMPVERPAAFVPQSLSSVVLSWQEPQGLGVFVQGQWVGPQVNYYADYAAFPQVTYATKRLPGFSVFDLVLSHPVRIGDFEADAFLKVDNLFDEQYSRTFGNSVDDRNYPMPGRTVFFGISPRL